MYFFVFVINCCYSNIISEFQMVEMGGVAPPFSVN